MWRAWLSLAVLLMASSCHVTFDDTWPDWTWNWDPIVLDGAAGCEWDAPSHGYVWYFEAEVDDLDGYDDIWGVEAHVYDDWRGGRLVDSFELGRTADPWFWYAEWPEHTTRLDCHYAGYSVDLVVWDTYDGYDLLTIVPRTY